MSSLGEALARARGRLGNAGIESAALDARVLAGHCFGLGLEALIRDEALPLDAGRLGKFRELVERRARGEPVAYLTGRREFWSLEFEVGPGCLIPRPDSESIVSALLENVGKRTVGLKVLDLGTGSGCILLALLSELNGSWGLGVDAEWRAVRIARANAAGLGLAERAAFLQGDWTAAIKGRFDVVVANPPYIPTADIPDLPRDVRDFEPRSALDGGPDGLDAVRKLMSGIGPVLAPGGRVAIEFGPGQAAKIEEIGHLAAGLRKLRLIDDLAGRTRGILFRGSGK